MRRKLAGLLALALLLACLNSPALADGMTFVTQCQVCKKSWDCTILTSASLGLQTHVLNLKCDMCGGIFSIDGNHDFENPGTTSGGHCRLCDYTCPHPSENREAADCVSPERCTVCQTVFGNINPTKHRDEEPGYSRNATEHQFMWLCCNAPVYDSAPHEWQNGMCGTCEYTCAHPGYTDGKCTICGLPCAHDWSNKDGVCTKCGYVCTYLPADATCTTAAVCSVCGSEHRNPAAHDASCTLQWTTTEATHKQTWSGCGVVKVEEAAHRWTVGKCIDCGYACTHSEGTKEWMPIGPDYHAQIWSCCKMGIAGTEARHRWNNGECTVCSYECPHAYIGDVCTLCGLGCTNAPEGATCITAADCSVCGKTHTNPNKHEATSRWIQTATTHQKVWDCCGATGEETAHRWYFYAGTRKNCATCKYVCQHPSYTAGICDVCGTACPNGPEGATCISPALCSACGTSHTNPGVHAPGCKQEWYAVATTHYKVWSLCGKKEIDYNRDHGFYDNGWCPICRLRCPNDPEGTDCMTTALCPLCGTVHNATHFHVDGCTLVWTRTETTHKQTWSMCGNVEKPEVTHSFVDGVCPICEYVCKHDWDPETGICRICREECSHDKTAVDAAVAATCTASGLSGGKHCTTCGKVLVEQQAVKALGHDYRAETTTSDSASGEVRYRCTRCGDSYTVEMDHQYGEWTDNGDGTHSVACLHDGCGYVATVECAHYELTVDEVPVGVCPICGKFGDAHFRIIGEAVCEPIDEATLPEGELLVRGLDLPMGEEAVAIAGLEEEVVPVYGFTFVFASDGQVVDLNAAVRLRVPMELDGGFRLQRLNVPDDAMDDATDAVPDDEEERWTELAYVYADGVLDFETDAAGLFLLLPLEEA